MTILIDMNLSPDWVPFFKQNGIESIHWSTVGDARAKDHEIMAWALANHSIVFTHDLDFGTMLAITGANGPSVIQLRMQDVLPQAIGDLVLALLHRFSIQLEDGAIVVAEPNRSRVRLLPLQ